MSEGDGVEVENTVWILTVVRVLVSVLFSETSLVLPEFDKIVIDIVLIYGF